MAGSLFVIHVCLPHPRSVQYCVVYSMLWLWPQTSKASVAAQTNNLGSTGSTIGPQAGAEPS
jgi:hypothetical protein